MKQLLFGLLASLSLLVFANAKSPIVPAFKGKLHNYSSLDNSELQIRANIDCTYKSGIVWPETKSCGTQTQIIEIKADGSYQVPNFNWQKRSRYGNYSFSFSLQQKNSPSSLNAYGLLSGQSIKQAAKAFAQVSLYETPEIHLNVTTPTGENYSAWRGSIEGQPNSPCAYIVLRYIADAKNLGENFELRGSSSDEHTAGFLPKTWFATSGNPGKSLKLKAMLYHWSSKPECKINQSKAFPAEEFTGTLEQIRQQYDNGTYNID